MRYASKRNDKAKQVSLPTEVIIPLLTPVRIYSAKELAAMPLTQMNAAIEAQEEFYLLEQTTQMGGGSKNYSPINGRWPQAYPGKRKESNSLQDPERIYPAAYCSSIREARFSEVGRVSCG
ncbi:hypothetical protein KTJ30_10835 [Acinetobacter radioresistens]|nr:hypothetical protein [Acinetobacter radioresistens]